MGEEQQREIRAAASAAMFKLTSMIGFPSLVSMISIDMVIADLEKIQAIVYEIDAKNSHDDSTAIPERKAA